MTHFRIPLAIALFLIPILARTIWFYQGIFWRTAPVATPEYNTFAIPGIPLSTPAAGVAENRSLAGSIILLDQMHSNQFSASELDSLARILNVRGARLESVSSGSYNSRSFPDQLKYASAYITAAPMDVFPPEEVQLLRDFVLRGGRLLVLTDPTRMAYDYSSGSGALVSDVISANTLLAPFDISFSDDYLYNMVEYEGNFRNTFFRTFGTDPITKGLQTVVLYASHSIQTTTGTPLLIGSEKTLTSRTDSGGGLTSAALDSSGKVLAIGDMTFLQPPYNQVEDNPILIQNLADFLLGAERIPDLADFPYLFRRPAAIVPQDDVTLNADLLGPINALQRDLAGVGIVATISPAPENGKDLIILGTYNSDGIAGFLKPFGIKLPSDVLMTSGKMNLEIPGFGSVQSFGTGLILYSQTKTRSTLLILAESSISLLDLLDVIGPEGFSKCIVQGNVAVCGLGSSSGSSYDSWWNPFGDSGSTTLTPAAG